MMRRRLSQWLPALGLAAAAAVLTGRAHAVELDKYIPAASELVIHINVRQILDSPRLQEVHPVQGPGHPPE